MRKILGFPLLLILYGVVYFPYIGCVYLMLMLLAGIGTKISSVSPLAYAILGYGWKVYVGGLLVTWVIVTTMYFQHCCVGIQSFIRHLKHARGNHYEAFTAALLWPIAWPMIDRNMCMWGIPWYAIVLNALKYWFHDCWAGARVGTRVEMLRVSINGGDNNQNEGNNSCC